MKEVFWAPPLIISGGAQIICVTGVVRPIEIYRRFSRYSFLIEKFWPESGDACGGHRGYCALFEEEQRSGGLDLLNNSHFLRFGTLQRHNMSCA